MATKRAPDRTQVLAGVSRETGLKLEQLAEELVRWQSVKNLVGPATLPELWTRHVADSLQLLRYCPEPGAWLDLGSGGGFPGLVIAIQRTERGLGPTHLVEANQRKCAFLLHCARIMALDVKVHPLRIEALDHAKFGDVVAVSARALAPLAQLIAWSSPLLRNGATGIFPKGQDVELELKEAATSWDFAATLHPSITDPSARIVMIRMGQQAEHADVR